MVCNRGTNRKMFNGNFRIWLFKKLIVRTLVEPTKAFSCISLRAPFCKLIEVRAEPPENACEWTEVKLRLKWAKKLNNFGAFWIALDWILLNPLESERYSLRLGNTKKAWVIIKGISEVMIRKTFTSAFVWFGRWFPIISKICCSSSSTVAFSITHS